MMTREPIVQVSAQQVKNWENGFEQEPQSILSLVVRMLVAITVTLTAAAVALGFSGYFAIAAMLWVSTLQIAVPEPVFWAIGILVLIGCLLLFGFIAYLISKSAIRWARRITSVIYYD